MWRGICQAWCRCAGDGGLSRSLVCEIESVEIENVRIFVTEADVHVAVDLPEGGAAVDVEIDAVEDC